MSGSGNIGGANNPNRVKISTPKIKQNQPTPTETTQAHQNSSRNQEVRAQNRGVFKNPTISQHELGFDPAEKAAAKQLESKESQNTSAENRQQANNKDAQSQSDTGLKKEYDLNARNAALAAKLKNRGKEPNLKPPEKNKKAPPKPSVKVMLAGNKGPINPRKAKPNIPNRLQSFKDDGMSGLDKLNEALGEVKLAANQNPQLISQYAKKLLSQAELDDMKSAQSLAQKLGLDEGFLELDAQELKQALLGFMEEVDEPEMKALLGDIIEQLQQDQTPLKAFVQLFLPYPFPYIFNELDDEFFLDEQELLEDFEDDQESSEEDENEEADLESDGSEAPVIKADTLASISIKTINFGKMHLLMSHDKSTNRFKLKIKGDPEVDELGIALEANLDDDLSKINSGLDMEMTEWHENVLRITESRALQIDSAGTLSPIFLKACNSIMKTVYENDLESFDGTLEASFV